MYQIESDRSKQAQNRHGVEMFVHKFSKVIQYGDQVGVVRRRDGGSEHTVVVQLGMQRRQSH